MANPNLERAKQAAAELVEEAPFGPVDVEAIARKRGIQIVQTTFGKFADEISGFCDLEENRIFVNSEDTPLRQRFTIGHELGHFVLHQNANHTVFPRFVPSPPIPVEQEANHFADHLLIPEKVLPAIKHFLGIVDPGDHLPQSGVVVPKSSVASFFGVSEATLDRRLKSAGLA